MNYFSETFVQWAQMWLPSDSLPGLAENDIAFVSRSDVAMMAASILVSDGHDGATYHATGAQAFSGQARAALIARYSGKPFAFERFAEDEFKARLIQSGMPDLYANGVLEIERHSVAGSYDIVTDDMEQLTGRAPQALASIVHSLLRPRTTCPE